jgi:lipopolysaccharide transport system permease protein
VINVPSVDNSFRRSSALVESKSSTEKIHQIVIEATPKWRAIDFRELWDYRELLFMLAIREVKLRYRQTFLGISWVILQPLITTVIFTFIFGRLLGADSENVQFELFAFTGLIPWNIFSQSLQRGGVSLTRDIRLVTRIFFPRVIIPIANALSTLVDFGVSMLILFGLLIVYRVPITLSFLSLPVMIFIILLLSVGVGVVFAAMNVYYRDFTYVLPFLITIWMYASPLAYSSQLIPENLTWIYQLNPLVGIIDGFRWAIFQTINFPMNSLIYSLVTSILLFLIGMFIFRRLERSFADVI